MQEHMDMKGQVRVLLEDRQGHILLDQRHANRIVKTGRQLVAELYAGVATGVSPSRVTHMAVGTGNAAPADTQVALGAERARSPLGMPKYTEIVDDKGIQRIKVSLQAVFDFNEANGQQPLTEAGIFTGSAGGVMYNRVVFDPVTKSDAFKLTLMWDITF